MPNLSQTLRFVKSPTFRQAQSALIGQLTPHHKLCRKCNAPFYNRELQLSVNKALSSAISSSPKGEQSHVADTVMKLVCVCTQAVVKTISDGLYAQL